MVGKKLSLGTKVEKKRKKFIKKQVQFKNFSNSNHPVSLEFLDVVIGISFVSFLTNATYRRA